MHAIPEAPDANAGLSGGGGSSRTNRRKARPCTFPYSPARSSSTSWRSSTARWPAPLAIDAMMVVPEAIPQPQRSLLVHDHDMTSTLARFHGEPIELRVLDCKLSRDYYRRHIVLETARSRRPAEYGAMRVILPLLDEAAQAEVLQARGPLGGILTAHGITFRCCPGAFFKIFSNAPDRTNPCGWTGRSGFTAAATASPTPTGGRSPKSSRSCRRATSPGGHAGRSERQPVGPAKEISERLRTIAIRPKSGRLNRPRNSRFISADLSDPEQP